jgi:HAD superfamily hydrolase (TIGR01490 family)
MKTTVAAFDFDGTITYGDTLHLFLMFASPFKAPVLFAKISPWLLAYTLGFLSRKQMKQIALKAFFAGTPLEDLQKIARKFSLTKLTSKIKPESLKRIQWHQARGDRLILVSASIDTYLIPWAETVGFEKVLASRLEVIDGKVTGNILGKNCREEEKVRRLEEYLGPRKNYTLYAYGNSDGDRAMLDFSDYSFYNTMGEND